MSKEVRFRTDGQIDSSPSDPASQTNSTPGLGSSSTATSATAGSSSFGKKATTPRFALTVMAPTKPETESVIKRGDDVFISLPRTRSTTGLSPNAEEFTPGTQTTFATAATNITEDNGAVTQVVTSAPTPVGAANPVVGVIGQNGSSIPRQFNPDGVPYPISFTEATQLHYANLILVDGRFSNEEHLTRAFTVANIAQNEPYTNIADIVSGFSGLKSINVSAIHSRGICAIAFFDIGECEQAFALCAQANPHWNLQYLNPQDVAIVMGDQPPAYVNPFEGQLIVTTFYDTRGPLFDGAMALHTVFNSLRDLGSLKAFHTRGSSQGGVKEIRVEYHDVRCADMALTHLQGKHIGPLTLQIEPLTAFIPPQRPVPAPARPQEQLSITGRSTVPVNDAATMMAMVNLGNPGFGSSSTMNHRNNHNTVSVGKIQEGLDVRTTIMLRNIPNKINQAMLKDILDETSFGEFDFMYLRIDFANNCNVGYAFVNFVDPLAIIPFALTRAGQRWNRFNSDKVAEISYATIQGRDCLIQKFRNSSVMLEAPGFRPMLYITAGPHAGEEEPFPGPDNPSKMRRSVENAETVGLFVPGARRERRDFRRPARGRGFFAGPQRLHPRTFGAAPPARALPPYPGAARGITSLPARYH